MKKLYYGEAKFLDQAYISKDEAQAVQSITLSEILQITALEDLKSAPWLDFTGQIHLF